MSVMIPLAGDAAKRAPSGCRLTCAIALECRGVFVWRLRVVSELRVGLAPLPWMVSPPCRGATTIRARLCWLVSDWYIGLRAALCLVLGEGFPGNCTCFGALRPGGTPSCPGHLSPTRQRPCVRVLSSGGRRAARLSCPSTLVGCILTGGRCVAGTGPAVAHDRIFVIGLGAFGAVRQVNPNHCTLMGGTPP